MMGRRACTRSTGVGTDMASGTRLRVQDAGLRASKYGMLAERDAPGEAERGAGRRHVKSSALPVSPTTPDDGKG